MSEEITDQAESDEILSPEPAAPTIYCEKCGVKNLENNYRCTACGYNLHDTARPVISTGDDSAAMRLLLPVGRSGLAIVSGYLGLVSILLLPAPAALITGILAIRDIRRNPEKHGMGRAIFGLVMGMFGTVLFGFLILGLVLELLRNRS
ncbi:DUF4190 domain-containing protein [bacterium]|nr:DUF4190 domain-containing protein [bacterium]